jgi:hypothetical protein
LESQLQRQQEPSVPSASESNDGAKTMQPQGWSLQADVWPSVPGSRTTDRDSETQKSKISNMNNAPDHHGKFIHLHGSSSISPSRGTIHSDIKLHLCVFSSVLRFFSLSFKASHFTLPIFNPTSPSSASQFSEKTTKPASCQNVFWL